MSKGYKSTRTVWEGVDDFSQWLRDTPGVVTKDVEAALFQEGSNIMGVAKKMTPVDTNTLRASAHVKLPQTKGGKTSVTLAYGTDYAVYVHEMIYVSHINGWAKYLEGPVKDAEKGMSDRLKRRVLDRIGKRGVL